ncbi:nagb/rpia/CoA transferase-like protein [Auriculariales sp. MPI-PUGE-AT-0066]|nr:nagb/rpia/CoA transferase-like protein [Auriculariales sp. MPI-PUGE-AT-0066]
MAAVVTPPTPPASAAPAPAAASNPAPAARIPLDVVEAYNAAIKYNASLSSPLAAILALGAHIESADIRTTVELIRELDAASARLKQNFSNIGVACGCNLFTRFVAQYPQSSKPFKDYTRELAQAARDYVQLASKTHRAKIARLALPFVQDDFVILCHSYSRVVMEALLLIAQHKRISVLVTDGQPTALGQRTRSELTAAGIPCTLILDSAVAYFIDRVDVCMVGSEAVVESGGLINAVGSYQMALVAKSANKPFYALAESYKFHRLFPLSQSDVSASALSASVNPAREPTHIAPTVDYTKPELISMVFSDVGVLTPDGVSQYLVSMFSE